MVCVVIVALLTFVNGLHDPETKNDDGAAQVAPAPMPELPAVSQMLNASGKTLTRIADQVNGLKDRLNSLAKSEETKLDQGKRKYEEELRAQEIETRRVEALNVKAEENNTVLKNGNDEMRRKAKGLQGSNKQLRQELRVMKDKLRLSNTFIEQTMHKTDDSDAKDLLILKSNSDLAKGSDDSDDDDDDDKDDDSDDDKDDDKDDRPARRDRRGKGKKDHTLLQKGESDDDDKDDDKEEGTPKKDEGKKGKAGSDDDAKTSFLAVRSHLKGVKNHKEEDNKDDDDGDDDAEKKDDADGDSVSMIHNLQTYLTKLSKEDSTSMQQLEKIFHQKWWEGKKKRASNVEKQRKLKIEMKKLQGIRASLEKSNQHLDKTKDSLEGALKNLGSFFRVLSHFAGAPRDEAAKMMDTLPKSVMPDEI